MKASDAQLRELGFIGLNDTRLNLSSDRCSHAWKEVRTGRYGFPIKGGGTYVCTTCAEVLHEESPARGHPSRIIPP